MQNYSRLEKRIYIPLPESNERRDMFKMHLGSNTPHTIKDHEWTLLGERSERLVMNLISYRS